MAEQDPRLACAVGAETVPIAAGAVVAAAGVRA
jgi:hypothetical protein